MNLVNVRNESYDNYADGLIDMLDDYHIQKEFYKFYESYDLKVSPKDTKSEEELYDKEKELLNQFIENHFNVGQILIDLHEKYPHKFKKNRTPIWNWDKSYDSTIVIIDWYEVVYNKEESISHIVDLIREHNINQEDIFNEVLKTS